MPLPHPTSGNTPWDAFAIAAPGHAPLIADELLALGITPRDVSAAGVAFTASSADLFAANLWSRIASRIIVRLDTFDARDFATLEKRAARVPWARVMAPGATVSLRVTCRKSKLYHSDAVAERVARGIERSVQGATIVKTSHDDITRDDDSAGGGDGAETTVVPTTAVVQRVIVRFEHDACTISADSSGELLHRRGWRQAVAKAPLRETLAAAMLTACGWTGDEPLVDPFCGSGTIGIEGALRARNIAPGLGRTFVMEQWPGVNPAVATSTRTMARAVIKPSAGVPIVMSDRDDGAIQAAHDNAERAGVHDDVRIERHTLSDVDLAPLGDHGLLLTNPPYGLRVSDGADLRSLYARLGDVLRAGGRGWSAAMLVPDKRLSGQLRMSMDSVLRTSNGGIAVTVEKTRLPSRVGS